MRLSDDATENLRKTVLSHSIEIRDEAERLAIRAGAEEISTTYVDTAVDLLRYRRARSRWGDAAISIGTALLGVSVGTIVAAAGAEGLDGWVDWLAYLCGVCGGTIFGAGLVLKLRE